MKELKTDEVFLDSLYLETRLRDFKEIRKKQIQFRIVRSHNTYSKSKYVEFYIGKYKQATLRVSDHIVDTPHTQFIVNYEILTKKKKAEFVRLVNKCFVKAKQNSLRHTIKKVEKNEKSIK